MDALERINYNYRECVGLDGTVKYEMHKNCSCNRCIARYAKKNGNRNKITVTVYSVSQLDKALRLIKNWECGTRSEIPVTYKAVDKAQRRKES